MLAATILRELQFHYFHSLYNKYFYRLSVTICDEGGLYTMAVAEKLTIVVWNIDLQRLSPLLLDKIPQTWHPRYDPKYSRVNFPLTCPYDRSIFSDEVSGNSWQNLVMLITVLSLPSFS